MEAELVHREGIPFQSIPAAGVHGVGWKALPGNLSRIRRGISASRRILQDFQPQVGMFTGGFVTVPMMIGIRLSGRPRPRSLIYVPDIEPGLALKMAGRFADRIAVTAEQSRSFFPAGSKVVVTGYPVRPDLQQWSRQAALEVFDLKPEKPVLLVFGGSKGARSLNRAVISNLDELLTFTQVIHITGTLDWEDVRSMTEHQASDKARGYRPFPYLHSEMGAAFTLADLVVSRAGASVLGEFPQFSLPAILVPYPHAWRYQRVNAEFLASRGAAVLVPDAELGDKLVPLVRELILLPHKLDQMSRSMKALANSGAAERIAQELIHLAAMQLGERDR
jgi:UDP-N-acetylglucosamine--N-acetylmuramyl-(pentapeptide) pyrophosphoryl-undecaprenol N-acetylglucosamine transferase